MYILIQRKEEHNIKKKQVLICEILKKTNAKSKKNNINLRNFKQTQN